MTRAPTSLRRAPRSVLAGAWLVAVVLALYVRTAAFDLVGVDDDLLVQQGPRSIAEAVGKPFLAALRSEPYYRPVLSLSLLFDEARGGGVAALRQTNIAIHAAASVLVFVLLRSLRVHLGVAVACATLFAVHPALASSVAWIPGRCDSLLGAWVFASLVLLVAYARSRSARALGGHLALFFLALLTKESAVVVPVVGAGLLLAITGRAFVRDRRLWLGWGVTMAAYLLLRGWALAGARPSDLGWLGRLGEAAEHARALLVDYGKLLAPVQLAVLAVMKDMSSVPGVLGVCAVVAAWRLLPSEARPLFLLGQLVVLAFCLPSLFVLNDLVLESRLYVPAAGMLLSVATCADALWSRTPRSRPLLAAGAALVASGLAVTTWTYAGDFRSPSTFLEAAVRQSPSCALAHHQYGVVLQRAQRLGEAEREYRTSLELEPDEPSVHANLGALYLQRGDAARALGEEDTELEQYPDNDNARYNRALAIRGLGGEREAEATARLVLSFEDAIRREPGDGSLRARLRAFCSERRIACDPELAGR